MLQVSQWCGWAAKEGVGRAMPSSRAAVVLLSSIWPDGFQEHRSHFWVSYFKHCIDRLVCVQRKTTRIMDRTMVFCDEVLRVVGLKKRSICKLRMATSSWEMDCKWEEGGCLFYATSLRLDSEQWEQVTRSRFCINVRQHCPTKTIWQRAPITPYIWVEASGYSKNG